MPSARACETALARPALDLWTPRFAASPRLASRSSTPEPRLRAPLTVEEHAEILEGYPQSDPVHRTTASNAPMVREAVARVEARLRVVQPR